MHIAKISGESCVIPRVQYLVRHPWTVPPSVAYILAIRDSISEVASPQSIRREPRTHMHRMSYFGTRRRHRAISNHLTLRSRPSIRNAISDVVTIVLEGKAVSENLPCQDSVLVLLHSRFLLGSMPCGMLCWLLSESYHMVAKNRY